jgi:trehalose synthase-fused probable maltokinase
VTAPTLTEVQGAVDRLDRAAIEQQRWFGAKGRSIERIELEAAFVLDEAARHVLAIVELSLDDRSRPRYTLPLTGNDLHEARPGDGTWRALAVAMLEGRTVAAMTADATTAPTGALVCRPGRAINDLVPNGAGSLQLATERDLGMDQSNTSVVVGDTVLVKGYRRLVPGLNPDLELTAFLTEEAGFTAVPQLAGFAEVVTTSSGTATVAMAQAYIADGADGYETVAEALTAWLLAPGEVSLEFATEVAADVGTLTAGLHASLADGHRVRDMAPRAASRAELRRMAIDAHAMLEHAVEVSTGDAAVALRDLAAPIADALSVLDGLSTAPRISRIHGDLHLGQVLISPNGYWVIDFEGQPFTPADQLRAHQIPLRDVASMLRSIDHVGRSAGQRALERNNGPLEQPGLDLDAWLVRARERFLETYTAGLRSAHLDPDFDPDVLRALEVDKEVYELAYAATYLPGWISIPLASIKAFFEAPPSD